MVNGYVNTETNYFMDNRLNLLNESTYNITNKYNNTNNEHITGNINSYNNSISNNNNQNDDQPFASDCCFANATSEQQASNMRGQTLVDILRVYYEFGPMVCGLVNLIDFIPKFYFTKPNLAPTAGSTAAQPNEAATSSSGGRETPEQNSGESPDSKLRVTEKIAPTESLTRLIRRSLAWFEIERKRILAETSSGCANNQQQLIEDDTVQPIQSSSSGSFTSKPVNLRVCNLQVYQKTILKNQLIHVNPTNALQSINTRAMVHRSVAYGPPIVCNQCSSSSSNNPIQNWCQHIHQLGQPYHLKFVRLAYVVPVYNRYALSIGSLKPRLHVNKRDQNLHYQQNRQQDSKDQSKIDEPFNELDAPTSSSSSSDTEDASSEYSSPFLITTKQRKQNEQHTQKQSSYDTDSKLPLNDTEDQSSSIAGSSIELDNKTVDYLLDGKEEELTKKAALDIVNGTNIRLKQDEEANQLNQNDNGLNDSPIGQLTYRLFAPCQLVNSSSCFSINPVNSSSPLARRGSVDLNGSGISSENAQPSTYLLGQQSSETQQVVTSFGAFFPALSQDVAIIPGSVGNIPSVGASVESNNNSNNPLYKSSHQPTSSGSRFTTNEFESVDAIKRRMEIYVTTNSMKVIAGETLIVNLSDVLSCLSTAIEQTVARASFDQRRSTSWVSVYILYAAVEEPQLPDQLLAQQKLRGLTLIDECLEENEDDKQEQQQSNKTQQKGNNGEPATASRIDSLFDDDFKGPFDNNATENETESNREESKEEATIESKSEQVAATTSGQIRIEQNPNDPSLTLYNSAYDRTVALPTQPDNHLDLSEPFECQTDCLWLNENDVIEALVEQMAQQPDDELESRKRRKKEKKKKKKSKKQHEDSQCSIM